MHVQFRDGLELETASVTPHCRVIAKREGAILGNPCTKKRGPDNLIASYGILLKQTSRHYLRGSAIVFHIVTLPTPAILPASSRA